MWASGASYSFTSRVASRPIASVTSSNVGPSWKTIVSKPARVSAPTQLPKYEPTVE